jgi:hypothetical protein
MSRPIEVLLLDDGELDDVQHLLEEMNVSFGRVRGGAIASETPPPSRLLVATPRRVDCVCMPEPGSEHDGSLVRIVVVNEDSTTLRARLRAAGFDFLVRRPVHPEALRLLLLRVLYRGEEKRGEPRIPVGHEISFRTGLLPRKGTLVDLSSRGCRLLTNYALGPGKRIAVNVPDGTRGDALTLKGRVVRIALDEHLGPEGPYSAGIAFEDLDERESRELHRLLEARSSGPATLGPAPETSGRSAARDALGDELAPPEARAEDLKRVEFVVDVRMTPEGETGPRPAPVPIEITPELDLQALPKEPPADERRRMPRGAYERRVPAFGDRAMRVLVARDLSVGGMRVERLPGLAVGDRLHLAVYGSADGEPCLVRATVARDDGSDGMGLVFDAVPPDVAERLEKVLVNLPAVESLHDDEAGAMGTVVSEILDD